MDLHQLRSFAAVAAEGHVTRAAEKLHLSQPTVSGHIRALEDELGVALFDRVASGVMLTRSGALLLKDAERVLAEAQHLRDHAKAVSGNLDAKLRIGTILDPDYLRLGELLTVMRDRYKLIDVELRLAVSGVGFEKVRSRELEAAFVLGETGDPDLRVVPLEPQQYRVVVPKGWLERVTGWESLAAMPWVLTPPKGHINRMAHDMLRSHRLAPSSVIEADQESTLRSLVAAGVGVSLLREDVVREAVAHGDIAIWPQGTARTVLSLIYLVEREQSPEIRVLLRAVEDVWHRTPALPAA